VPATAGLSLFMGTRRTTIGRALVSLAVAAAAPPAGAEDDPSPSPWSAFPILGYGPETSAILGGGVVFTFDVDRRPPAEGAKVRRSALALASAYTFENQFFVSLAPSVYWEAETWHAEGELSGALFPNTYYPVGNRTPASRAEDYTEIGFGAAGAVTRRLAGSFRTGGQVGFFHSEIADKQAGGDLDGDRVEGSDGGRLVGLGPVMRWDDRDNDFATQRGGRYALSASYFATALGSSFDVSKYELDLRHFLPLGGEHVLAGQLYGVANFGRVPFQTMATLGGANIMRGYFEGRYRDLHMLAAQVEYRMPLFWRFGGAVFAGAGDVAHELDDYRPRDLKAAGGGGVRFALNPADRVNLRLDVAGTSDGDLNFYITLGEAF